MRYRHVQQAVFSYRTGAGGSALVALALAFTAPLVLAGEQPAARSEDASEWRRPFGPNAPWNVRVTGLPRHPDSDRLADLLWSDAPSGRPGNFNLGFEEYTYPVYYAADATGLFPVKTTWDTPLDGQSMPWNPAWRPAPGTDAQVIVLDPKTGCSWDLWQVSFADGTIRATNGSRVPGDFRTYEGGNPPSRGIGIQYLAMLVRPQAVAAGTIDHALSMTIQNPDGTAFVAPATKLEHPGFPSGIPEGTRFALDVSDAEIEAWLANLPPELPATTRRSARTIAVALRDYGWFITDTAGGATLQFEANVTAAGAWRALGLEEIVVSEDRVYPRDLLDGLLTRERIYAIVPSDQYPEGRQ